ncbi:holo-[acyl-carrier-protein] synthase [Bacillus mangrovi]|uniref:Holo-[acyl-carrier-protein] synthase n=1 Tax=Metabacillus mangrovi TaxID=1491830 RepID=A0A7X2S7P7_9BACI|nr:holo-ACP synthase [Metabacillus mangrovi]MTH55172.1 holo-[acyl-carrier-protein] synthase [Metabacillus mangrovi]
MIAGIGMDIVEIKRIRRLEERQPRFPDRILGELELAVYEKLAGLRKTEFLAGRFACKEAFAKATGLGIGGALSFHDFQVVKGSNGAPEVIATGFEKMKIHVSITHTKEYAAAQIIMESLSS